MPEATHPWTTIIQQSPHHTTHTSTHRRTTHLSGQKLSTHSSLKKNKFCILPIFFWFKYWPFQPKSHLLYYCMNVTVSSLIVFRSVLCAIHVSVLVVGLVSLVLFSFRHSPLHSVTFLLPAYHWKITTLRHLADTSWFGIGWMYFSRCVFTLSVYIPVQIIAFFCRV